MIIIIIMIAIVMIIMITIVMIISIITIMIIMITIIVVKRNKINYYLAYGFQPKWNMMLFLQRALDIICNNLHTLVTICYNVWGRH